MIHPCVFSVKVPRFIYAFSFVIKYLSLQNDGRQALVHSIAREMLAKGKILAANYWAPVILANAGVLHGKKATVTPIEVDALKKYGAEYADKILTIDDNVITGNGSAASELYADLILAKILIDTFR